jgi:hypothetical protein
LNQSVDRRKSLNLVQQGFNFIFDAFRALLDISQITGEMYTDISYADCACDDGEWICHTSIATLEEDPVEPC